MTVAQQSGTGADLDDRRALLAALTAHRVPVARFRLQGGPRLLVAPRPGSGVVAVAVGAPAGFRTEAPGEEGLAHLLEHLLFRGGAEEGRFVDRVHMRGGTTNASTHLDHTIYWQELPGQALAEALQDEADRFLRPLIDEESVARQREIVLEEIASNVDNQPLGGFPWARLPAVAFRDHANRHNGYGTAASLAAATAGSARSFFDRFYHPGRLTLAVVGDTEPEAVRDLLHDLWPPAAEPPPVIPRPAPALFAPGRHTGTDPFTTAPAVAVGWPVPAPEREPRAHAATLLLADLLAGAGLNGLHARLVLGTGVARLATCYVGFNDPLQCRDPMLLVAELHLTSGADPDEAVALVRETVAALADEADEEALTDAALFALLAYWRNLEPGTGQARALAAQGVPGPGRGRGR
ncbi:insulinase family protein [Streptomyces sp. NPDC004542]|uniref:insulinase family protein n=1 Tax=Streptomyces sp. NPDC004542 TaxID=3154281 RepID=UPI0033BD5B56